jgi:hypothetical protein
LLRNRADARPLDRPPWGRGVIVLGVLMEGAGLVLSSLVQSFWQFVLVRCSLVIAGEALLGSLVINVTIAQWFVRKRGRAMGVANLGTGIAKLSIPLVAASLFVLIGWRYTWAVFGIIAPLLVVAPALIFVRRRPEDIGLHPDGEALAQTTRESSETSNKSGIAEQRSLPTESSWTRAEALRLPAFGFSSSHLASPASASPVSISTSSPTSPISAIRR